MTIKQQGGVFGRNPTFNDVDANSVTADQATVNGVLLADEVGINTSPSYPLHVVRDTNGFIAGFRNSDATTLARTIAAGNSLGDLVTAVLANTGHAVIYSDSGKTLALGANGSTTAALTVNTDQTVSFRENLIISNGKGIDFSATAGTGTSELLDDYEEGTWGSVTSGFTSATIAANKYTKIGRMVYCTISLSSIVYSGTGAFCQIVLPFNENVADYFSVVSTTNNATWNTVKVLDNVALIHDGASTYLQGNTAGAPTDITLSFAYEAT